MKKKLLSLFLSVTLVSSLLCMPVLAADTTTANPRTQVIPMRAQIDSSYVISIPAAYGGNGELNLTQAHNNEIHTVNSSNELQDTAYTFYGFLELNASGVLESDKQIVANVTTGEGLTKTGTTNKVPVKMLAIKTGNSTEPASALITPIHQIWGVESGTPAVQSIVDTNFTNSPSSLIWTSAQLASADAKNRTMLLRTTLSSSGIWTGDLTVNFGLGTP